MLLQAVGGLFGCRKRPAPKSEPDARPRPNPNPSPPTTWTPVPKPLCDSREKTFFAAIHDGKSDEVSFLLQHNADPNWFQSEPHGKITALHAAVKSPDILRHLLYFKARIDEPSSPLNIFGKVKPQTALRLAVEQGCSESAKFLIANKASLVGTLDIAVEKDANDIVRSLLAANATPEKTTLPFASSVAVIRILVEAKASVDTGVPKPPLAVAVQNERLNLVKELLSHGSDPNSGCPLHIAVDKQNLGLVEMLLKAKASTEIKDQNGATPLCAAVRASPPIPNVVRALLSSRASANAIRQPRGGAHSYTLLYDAANNDNITEQLLRANAEVNVRSKNQDTPLHRAYFYGNQDVVRLLTEAGANIHAKNDSGQTPAQVNKRPSPRKKRDRYAKFSISERDEFMGYG